MIDKFADASGDPKWIHVDVERAKREMPGGKTIAPGYLTISLLPQLAPTLMKIEKRRRGLNYGSNRVRFTAPVPAGGPVRLRRKLVKSEPVEGNGLRLTNEMTMGGEGNPRAPIVAGPLAVRVAEPPGRAAARRNTAR